MEQQHGGLAEAAVEAPPRRGLLRVPRRLLALYVRLIARHRFVGCLLGLVILLTLCGTSAWLARLVLPSNEVLAPLIEADTNELGTLIVAEEDSVEEYLDAMGDFDAQRMWDAYADGVRNEMASRGMSADGLQSGLDQARRNGATIDGHRSLGSYPLRDGRRYVFYIVRRSGFPPDGAPEELYFIFTVDRSGKILNVT
jgi:hypothetical protein